MHLPDAPTRKTTTTLLHITLTCEPRLTGNAKAPAPVELCHRLIDLPGLQTMRTEIPRRGGYFREPSLVFEVQGEVGFTKLDHKGIAATCKELFLAFVERCAQDLPLLPESLIGGTVKLRLGDGIFLRDYHGSMTADLAKRSVYGPSTAVVLTSAL